MTITHVTVVGAGVIGTSWTALMLAHGLTVTVTDPAPETEKVLREALPAIDPALDLSRLRVEPDLAKAVSDAGAVQENAPERLDFKQRLWADIETAAPADALLLTSTSGLRVSEVGRDLRQPGRLVVGHPFNPPHVLPLVEIVPGPETDPRTVRRAVDFYTTLGKRPLVLRKEIPGFVANRLQSALFREAVHLVREGVVTVSELDDIVTSSLGPRWAVAGPFRSFHLGGGPGGLAHFLDHLGPGLEAGWQRLGTPALDEPTRRMVTDQVAGSFGARPVGELAAERDRAQLAVLEALSTSTRAEENPHEHDR